MLQNSQSPLIEGGPIKFSAIDEDETLRKGKDKNAFVSKRNKKLNLKHAINTE